MPGAVGTRTIPRGKIHLFYMYDGTCNDWLDSAFAGAISTIDGNFYHFTVYILLLLIYFIYALIPTVYNLSSLSKFIIIKLSCQLCY